MPWELAHMDCISGCFRLWIQQGSASGRHQQEEGVGKENEVRLFIPLMGSHSVGWFWTCCILSQVSCQGPLSLALCAWISLRSQLPPLAPSLQGWWLGSSVLGRIWILNYPWWFHHILPIPSWTIPLLLSLEFPNYPNLSVPSVPSYNTDSYVELIRH